MIHLQDRNPRHIHPIVYLRIIRDVNWVKMYCLMREDALMSGVSRGNNPLLSE